MPLNHLRLSQKKMTDKEKERMLRELPDGHIVTILDCEVRTGVMSTSGKWIVNEDGHKTTSLIAKKSEDGYKQMWVLVGENKFGVPYEHLTCTAIQVLDTICPDDIYDVHEIDPDM
jgi:hypothetical protein